MKWYIEITLIPDSEIPLLFIWEKVFQQNHLALAEQMEDGQSKVGMSFPGYSNEKKTLGNRLRLFALEQEHLQILNISQWLERLTDYVHVKPIKSVPETVERFAVFKRKQVKSNIEKKAARRAEHLNKPYLEVLDFLLEENKNSEINRYQCDLPFVYMKSLSSINKDRFPIFIERQWADTQVSGNFNSYGLSKKATIPWF